ncbi:zinc ribbon domain-containing protein [Streptomyces sp. NPDC058739]|uniref:zinc ribbon domain-containing protein n=1 Tax=Streptomyces sp. NPDC058739 TaxID=3346618 RepID=UPI003687AC6D
MQETETPTELLFLRCTWCGTATIRRSSCPACWSAELVTERSEGVGVVAPRRTTAADRDALWPVRMKEGFVVRCRVAGPPHAVRPGVQVRLAGSAAAVAGERIVRGELLVRPCVDAPLDGWIRDAG